MVAGIIPRTDIKRNCGRQDEKVVRLVFLIYILLLAYCFLRGDLFVCLLRNWRSKIKSCNMFLRGQMN